MPSFSDKLTSFDIREQRIPFILWVGKATIIKQWANVGNFLTSDILFPISAPSSCSYSNWLTRGLNALTGYCIIYQSRCGPENFILKVANK